jgi:hypothetical protein
MVIDLSYAKNGGTRPLEEGTTLGVRPVGWTCAWAIARKGHPKRYGKFVIPDKSKDRKFRKEERISLMFYQLLKLCAEDKVTHVCQAHEETDRSPAWAIPPLLAITCLAKYHELPDWKSGPKIDDKTLLSWATVTFGQEVSDKDMAEALGLAVVGSIAVATKERAEQVGEPTPEDAAGMITLKPADFKV